MFSKVRRLVVVLMLAALLLPAPTRRAQASPESDLHACLATAGTVFWICMGVASSFTLFGPSMALTCDDNYAIAIDRCAANYDAAVAPVSGAL
jgi:hypothetical protein